MIYIQQAKWLTDNGFEEFQTDQLNTSVWIKRLSDNRELQFVRNKDRPEWKIVICGEVDAKFDNYGWSIDSVPSYADFNQFQPLIDIIK